MPFPSARWSTKSCQRRAHRLVQTSGGAPHARSSASHPLARLSAGQNCGSRNTLRSVGFQPAIMNWISRAPSNSAASPDRSSLEVLNVKSAPVLRSASARAAASSSVRYTTALAPARASATIALRLSLSSKVTTNGGRLNSMHPQDYRDSARDAAPNIFDSRDPLGKSEWPNGDWEAAQGGHPRQEDREGTAQETHAAEASAETTSHLAARREPGTGSVDADRQT